MHQTKSHGQHDERKIPLKFFSAGALIALIFCLSVGCDSKNKYQKSASNTSTATSCKSGSTNTDQNSGCSTGTCPYVSNSSNENEPNESSSSCGSSQCPLDQGEESPSSSSSCGTGSCPLDSGDNPQPSSSNYSKGFQTVKSDPLNFYFNGNFGKIETIAQVEKVFQRMWKNKDEVFLPSFHGYAEKSSCIENFWPGHTRQSYMLGIRLPPSEALDHRMTDGGISDVLLAKLRVKIGEQKYLDLLKKIYECEDMCAKRIVESDYSGDLQSIQ